MLSFFVSWEQRKLSQIVTMHARIGWQNLRTSEYLKQGKYMLITGTDFENGMVNFSTCYYINKERYDQDKNIQVQEGSILVTKDGTLGKVAYINRLNKPATLNAGVFNIQLKDKKNNNSRYIFQYLKAPFLMNYVYQTATGGTIKHLNQNILVDFPIMLPKNIEQCKIGMLFCELDNLITLHQRKLKVLKLKKQLRLKHFSITWEQCKLGECVLIQRGGSPRPIEKFITNQENGVNWIKIGDVSIDSRYITKTEEKIIFEGIKYSRKVKIGDLILSNSMSFGRPYIMAINGCIHDGWLLIRNDKNIFDLEYLLQLLSSDYMYKQYQSLASGGVVNNLNSELVQSTIALVPNKSEQLKIGKIFKQLDNLISLHQRKYKGERRDKYEYFKKKYTILSIL